VRPRTTGLLAAFLLLSALASPALELAALAPHDPHGNPETGVLRLPDEPRGSCRHCHPTKGDSWDAFTHRQLLFEENTNDLAFAEEGPERCHRRRPSNYPLGESDRIPEGRPDAGYFEANSSGTRRTGLDFRGRWPGERVFRNARVAPGGRYYSPHGQDPQMPRRDPGGEGLCLNCHDPHGTPNAVDVLTAPYGGIDGHAEGTPPAAYGLCFTCHATGGPAGMEATGQRIADYYDSGLNGEQAGHQIRKNPRIALSWPSHVQAGDKLPCYDCHNPHGSEGNNRVEPNAFVISDQRREWSGIVDPAGDAVQSRRFCLGCHIPSDGIPGTQSVEGIVMNTISDREGHAAASAASCHDCHGRDYSGPTTRNVHNPDPGTSFFDGGAPWPR
jgi:hypothetical protein